MFGHFCSLDNVLVIILVQTRLWGGFVWFRSSTKWLCPVLELCEIVYIQQEITKAWLWVPGQLLTSEAAFLFLSFSVSESFRGWKPSLNFSLILCLNSHYVQADLFVRYWRTVLSSSVLLLFLENIPGEFWPCPGSGLHDLGSRS